MVKNLKSICKELGIFQSIEPKDKEKLSISSIRRDKLSAEQHSEILEAHEKYMETVISEKKGLLDEINNFVNRLEMVQ
jgi:hypothetical protein